MNSHVLVKPFTHRVMKACAVLLWMTLVFAPLTASAEIVSGHHEFDFEGELSLWDASGSYSRTLEGGGSLSMDIVQDGKGKITGSGTAFLGGINLDFDIKGSMKGKGGVTAFKMKMKFKGTGNVEGESVKFKGSWNYAAEVDEVNRRISGSLNGKLKVTVQGLGSEKVALPGETFDLEFEDGMDGSFTLMADFQVSGNKITGSGAIEFDSGDAILFAIKGKYSARKDSSKVAFKATSSKGAKLKIVLDGNANIASLKGKVLGQKLAM